MPIYDIVDNNVADFNNKLKTHDFICFYYWNQCGHCIQFKPLWNKISKKYEKKANIASIELSVMNNKNFDKKYSVNMFPTIIIYKKGKKFAEFIEQRTEKNLSNFIIKNI